MELRHRIHPIVLAAALAVLFASTLGAAALMGWLPRADSGSADSAVLGAVQAPPAGRAARGEQPARPVAAARCATCGIVESIQAVQVEGEASGLGAVAGGVTGAIVGSRFGRGDGRSVMTIAGAAGGAYAGNAIEKSMKRSTGYRITLRMDDGATRALTLHAGPAFAVGDRVRIVKGSSLERI